MKNAIQIILVLVVTIVFSWLFRYEVFYHHEEANAVVILDRWEGKIRLILALDEKNSFDRIIFPSNE